MTNEFYQQYFSKLFLDKPSRLLMKFKTEIMWSNLMSCGKEALIK